MLAPSRESLGAGARVAFRIAFDDHFSSGYDIGVPPGRALRNAVRHLFTATLQPNRIVDLCGVVCILGYATLAWYSHGTIRAPALPGFFLLLGWVSLPLVVLFAYLGRQPEALSPLRLLGWAALFRVCGVFGVPLFEDDWYRYLWDSYRFAHTGTPYGWAPVESFADPHVPLVFQRILDQVNYPDLPTIYGPTTQYIFLLSYFLKAGSLVPLQLIFISFDLLLIRLLLSVAPARFVLLYAWCPLVIKEIAFTAHPDGMGACLLFAAVLLRRRAWTGGAATCLALAVGAKLLAILLVPFVLARAGLRTVLVFCVVLALLYLPFLLQGSSAAPSLATFARAWEFNSALYGLLTRWLSGVDAKLLLSVGVLTFVGVYWLRYRQQALAAVPRGDWIYGLFLFSAPVINPWYLLWLLPFAVVYPSLWAWTASWALLLSYITGLNLGNFELEPFAHPAWVRPLEFGLIVLSLCVDIWRRARRVATRSC